MSIPATETPTRAVGIGLATVALDGTVLDTWYPLPELTGHDPVTEEPGTVVVPASELEPSLVDALGTDEDRGVEVVAVRTVADLTGPPTSAYDVYLRLHLLSHRLVRPHGVDLTGMFGLLANVVWTNHGPCPVPGFERVRARLRGRGPVTVYAVDKFPRMVDYVIPGGVRIGDADRVRLGAHLAEGTTVMHEGFVNFNAGHPRRLDGRGPHLGRRGRRGRLRRRRRRVDHGHAVRGRQGGHLARRALPPGRQRRDRHLARRRLRGRGRPLRHRRHEGHPRRTGASSRPSTSRAAPGCCSAGTRRRAPSRPSPAPRARRSS